MDVVLRWDEGGRDVIEVKQCRLERWSCPRTKKTQMNGVGMRRQWGRQVIVIVGSHLPQWRVLGEISVTHDVTMA